MTKLVGHFESEQEMMTHVVAYYEARGWDVYQEVPPLGSKGREIDVVAVGPGGVITAIEGKLSMNTKVIAQAKYWRGMAEYCVIAIPRPWQKRGSPESEINRDMVTRYGLGLMHVGTDGRVEIEQVPKRIEAPQKWSIEKVLNSELRGLKPAGSKGIQKRPDQQAELKPIWDAVKAEPDMDWKQLYLEVGSKTRALGRTKPAWGRRVREMGEQGKIPFVRTEVSGGILRFFPVEAGA